MRLLSAGSSGWIWRWPFDLSLTISHGTTSTTLVTPCLLLVTHLRRIVDQERLQWQVLRQKEVANVVTADGQVVEGDGFAPLHCQLYCF